MKKMLITMLAVICMASLTLGQTNCPDQPYKSLTGYSVVLDQSKIALGPADPNGVQKPLLLNVVVIVLGQTAQDKLRACEPDGDMVEGVWCEEGTITPEPNEPEYYRWQWTPPAIGVWYRWVETRDVRPETNDSITTRGTEVVIVVPKNRPVNLCGGQP